MYRLQRLTQAEMGSRRLDVSSITLEQSRMDKRAAAKLDRRNRFLTAARQLFADQGYERTTIRAIADLAGESVGALLATFEGKEDILAAILSDGGEKPGGDRGPNQEPPK